MNRFKSALRLLLGIAVTASTFAQLGCSSEQPASSVEAGKVSKRDEAGKKFPFPDATNTKAPSGGAKK
jgi:hypothetical protein